MSIVEVDSLVLGILVFEIGTPDEAFDVVQEIRHLGMAFQNMSVSFDFTQESRDAIRIE